jgi:hypothetical protein
MYDSKFPSESRSLSPEKRVLRWLRKRISPYCWGQSNPDKNPTSRSPTSVSSRLPG